jgi:hypothetical protein
MRGRVGEWFAGRGRSVGAGALVLAALAVGRVVTDRLPDAEAVIEAPVERHAAIGEAAHLRVGEVTVREVTGSTEWAGVIEGKRTTGVWLAADIDLLPSRRESGISYAAVRDASGHVWDLGRGTSTCKGTIAGVPMRCQVVIELPARAIPGAELVLRWTDFDERFDDQAVVPLRLDEATMKGWAASTTPIQVPNATLGAP